MSSSRSAVRRQLAALLTVNVSAAQVVYNHRPGDFGGQSPAVVVGSGGSERPRLTFEGCLATFYLDVDVFTLTAEAAVSPTYTPTDSEDAGDLVEQQIAQVIEDNQKSTLWNKIDYASRSTTSFVGVDGLEYKRERIPLALQVYA